MLHYVFRVAGYMIDYLFFVVVATLKPVLGEQLAMSQWCMYVQSTIFGLVFKY